MKITLKDPTGAPGGETELGFEPVLDGRGTQAVHDAVVALMASKRRGTACTKNAGEVAGTNKKPWRQKGTGRARAGSFQSPLWRGGGVVFGPKPRDFSKKINQKTRQLGLRKAISERIKAGDVLFLTEFPVSTNKTRDLIKSLGSLGVDGSTLLIDREIGSNLRLASRNIPWIEVSTGRELNAYLALKYDKLVLTRAALDDVAKRLQ